MGKENSVTTQADKSSNLGKVDQDEKDRINSVISKASQSSASFDLKKLSDESKKSSQKQKTFVAMKFKTTPNLEMIWCPPGSHDIRRDGRGLTNVILTEGFYMGKYEVTNSQYEYLMGYKPNSLYDNKDAMPVTNISIDGINEFLKKLNQLEKHRILEVGLLHYQQAFNGNMRRELVRCQNFIGVMILRLIRNLLDIIMMKLEHGLLKVDGQCFVMSFD